MKSQVDGKWTGEAAGRLAQDFRARTMHGWPLKSLTNNQLVILYKAAKQITVLGNAAAKLLRQRQINGSRAHNRAMDDKRFFDIRRLDSEARKIAREAAPALRLQRKLTRQQHNTKLVG